MPIEIARLICNVTVHSKEKRSPLHRDPKPKQPDLLFKAPTDGAGQAPPAPSQTASEDKGPASGKHGAEPTHADPRKVADQVYELMLQEIRLSRMRQGRNSR